MARSKEFDVEQALDRAVELFWRKGYEATSMRDLQEHMGIGRQSLYDTFGDKRQLFLAALDRYNAGNAGRVRETLLDEDASLPALRAWFDDLIAFLTPRGERVGCLLANSIVELGQQDPEVASCCRGGEKVARRGFRAAAARAIARGELAAADDPDEVADYLQAQVYGLTVLAKNGASRTTLKRVVERAFVALGAAEPL